MRVPIARRGIVESRFGGKRNFDVSVQMKMMCVEMNVGTGFRPVDCAMNFYVGIVVAKPAHGDAALGLNRACCSLGEQWIIDRIYDFPGMLRIV